MAGDMRQSHAGERLRFVRIEYEQGLRPAIDTLEATTQLQSLQLQESEAALAEIAKLMSAHPDLKVYIVGHTDMVGDAAANLKLAQARAQSVVTALSTKNGIAAARMIPFGAGPYAPVATNRTEEGRAKNRRVELVEIATR